MRETTFGIMIALSLSAPLALAQDSPGQDNAKQENATKDAPVAADSVKTDAKESEDGVAARPEMTKSAVITDKLTRGEKMELTIRFKVDSDQIKGQAHKQILEISHALKGPELLGKRIGVQGHTDSDGPDDYNEDLSYRRGVTVVRTLVDTYGIEPTLLDVIGYGESRPIASNETAEGKAANRRVTLVNLNSGKDTQQ